MCTGSPSWSVVCPLGRSWSVVCPLALRGSPVGRPAITYGVLVGYAWVVRGAYVDRQWDARGGFVGFPCTVRGVHVGCLSGVCGCPWVAHGVLFGVREVPMSCLRVVREVSVGRSGPPVGRSWGVW